MRKLFLIFTSILLTTNVFADAKSDALLDALQKKEAGWGNYRVDFSLTIVEQSIKGSYVVSGVSYHIETKDVEVFCDGQTRWEVNHADKEVTIDKVDPADRSVLGNPTRLFDFLGGSYTHSHVGSVIIGGVYCDRIELQAAGGQNVKSGEKTDVYISAASGLPVRIVYRTGSAADATIDIAGVTPNYKIDMARFMFDAARYEGFEIIDFR